VADLNHELKSEDLGARIKAVRELAGVEQRELARAAGLSRRELQNAERGLKRLSPDKLKAVADVFGVDPDVLVGVGFDGELKRAAVQGHFDGATQDAGRWSDHPAPTTSDAPPALPVNLPNPERRKDFATRNRIEASWRDVRSEMGDALTSCARLISAGSGDDVRRLIERLERDLTELKTRRAFLRKLADHENALQRVRQGPPPAPRPAPTDAAPSQPVVSGS
jgi:transcriptional regulator with XRE-family HTH domain